jgi:hypothetical protein
VLCGKQGGEGKGEGVDDEQVNANLHAYQVFS